MSDEPKLSFDDDESSRLLPLVADIMGKEDRLANCMFAVIDLLNVDRLI